MIWQWVLHSSRESTTAHLSLVKNGDMIFKILSMREESNNVANSSISHTVKCGMNKSFTLNPVSVVTCWFRTGYKSWLSRTHGSSLAFVLRPFPTSLHVFILMVLLLESIPFHTLEYGFADLFEGFRGMPYFNLKDLEVELWSTVERSHEVLASVCGPTEALLKPVPPFSLGWQMIVQLIRV